RDCAGWRRRACPGARCRRGSGPCPAGNGRPPCGACGRSRWGSRPRSGGRSTRTWRSCRHRRLVGVLGRPADGPDDVLVAGAAAHRAADGLADLLGRGIGVNVEQRPGGDHHGRRAEPALEAVLPHEPFLDRVEPPVLLHPLDGADLPAGGHGRQHGAALHRHAVHGHDADAAVRGVAPPVRAGQPEVVPEEVHEEQPRLHLPGDLVAVDGHGDLHGYASCPRARATARRNARRVSSPARCRLYSAGPRWSVWGFVTSAAAAAAAARFSAVAGRPRSTASAASAQKCGAPTAVRPMPTSTTVSPSAASTTKQPPAVAPQSPARRSTFSYALPAPGRIGIRTSVRISAGPTTVS